MNVSQDLKGFIACALLLSFILAIQKAHASVVFDFGQVGTATRNVYGGSGGTEPSPLTFSARFVVTDDTYARGFTFLQSNGSGIPHSTLDGLLGFTTTTVGGLYTGNGILVTTIADYNENFDPMYPGWGYRPGSGRYSNISLSYSRNTGLIGDFRYNTGEFDYHIGVVGNQFAGNARSDYGLCLIGCVFAGNVTTMRNPGSSDQVISVPEPSSMGLFGIGLLSIGLLGMRTIRHRKAA